MSKIIEQTRVKQLKKTQAIKLNKLQANKSKLEEIILHILIISMLASKMYQHHHCLLRLEEIPLSKYLSRRRVN